MKAHAIALDGRTPLLISITTEAYEGSGNIAINGQFLSDVEDVAGAALSAASTVANYYGIDEAELTSRDLIIHVKSPAPLIGPSYGLALAVSIISSIIDFPIFEAIFTGEISPNGNVLPVGDIDLKRLGALKLGFSRIVLPRSQCDWFDPVITQRPVSNIFEALNVPAD